MPEILITVRDKIAQLANRSVVVCDNTDYVAVFDFDGEWDAYPTKTAQFNFGGIHIPVVFDGTACPMPQVSEASVLRIGVYAGDLHTTTSALVPCLPSIRGGEGAPADPPDDVYDQIMQKLNDMGEIGEEEIAAAVEGYLEAHPVEAPVTSVNGKDGDVALTAEDVGAEPEIFYVSLWFGGDPGEGITNKTYSEIRSALDAGQRVIGYVGDVPAQLISCASINSSGEHAAKFLFIDTNSSQFYIFTVYDSRYCLVDWTATCKIIVVEVTQSDSGDLTANRSAHDIKWSVESEGHTVMLRRDETYYQLSGIRNNYVDFSAVLFDSDGAYLQKITIDYKRVVSVSESRASAGTLVVNFTTDGNGEGTADCTFSQVCETLDNGGAVVGYLNDVILQACVRTDDEITFYIPLNVLDASVAGATYIYLLSDDTVLTEARPITALPNPHKLTLTGAVKAEYDGSTAVSVEIPAGGGGDSSLGITGASVGQTVKITEVDDNGRPTAWEAVEMAGAKSWRRIADITLEEDATELLVDTDEAGNALSLQAMSVRFVLTGREGAINGAYWAYMGGTSALYRAITATSGSAANIRSMQGLAYFFPGSMWGMWDATAIGTNLGTPSSPCGTRFYIVSKTEGFFFPAGSRLVVYGIDA